MPELAAMYLVGAVVSMIVGLAFGLKQRAKYHKSSTLCLQKNLKKIGYRWNDLNLSVEAIVEDAEGADQAEYKKARFTSILFTIVAVAFSWIGLFFLIIMWVSLKFLMNSRAEKALLVSPLSSSELTISEIKNIFDQLVADSKIILK